MLYFGSGNPFPIPMETLPVGITVTDLAPGNYSVKFMLLDPDRQPTGIFVFPYFVFQFSSPSKAVCLQGVAM